MAAHGELRNRHEHQPGQAAVLAGAPQVRRAASSSWSPAARRCPTRCTRRFTRWASTSPRATASPRRRRCSPSPSPGNKRQPGHASGRALPGHRAAASTSPDDDGIGEVIARGPQRDGGLLRRPRGHRRERSRTAGCTPATSGGWTPTGGCTSSGRKKDVIIDANGKNVYPDELEELYGRPRAHQGAVDRRAARTTAGGEKVACLCVPGLQRTAPREEVRRGAGGALPQGLRRAALLPAGQGAALLGRASCPGPPPAR